jgi:hypothetical protein
VSQTAFDLSEPLIDTSNEFQFGDGFLFGTESSGTSWGSTAPGPNESSTAATSVEEFNDDYSFDMQHGSTGGEDTDFSSMLDAGGDAMDAHFPFNHSDSSTHTPPMDLDASSQWLMDPHLSSDLQSMINATSKPKLQDVECHSNTRQQTCSMRLLRLLPSLETKPVGSNGTAPTLSRILERNSAVLDSVDEMLNCECLLHDRQCLIVGLIVTKVLAWYGAVMAGKDSCDFGTSGVKNSVLCQESWASIGINLQPMQNPKAAKTNVGSYPLENGGNTRMRAQLVLSELRHVLRTLDRWSQRHQETSRLADKAGVVDSRGYGSAMCVLVEADLRAALQARSREAMQSLH